MEQICVLLNTGSKPYPASTVSGKSFLVSETFWASNQPSDQYLYQKIVYKIQNQPENLILHLQRIYYCYNRDLAETLFAALVDLLMVLEGKGKLLSQRMILSSRSVLTTHQFSLLVKYLDKPNVLLLNGNKFSIFTKGLLGSGVVIQQQENVAITHDPLTIARDYIEFSQLDDAITTLETGVLEYPDRQDIKSELLQLYKATRNIKLFTIMHRTLIDKKLNLCNGWQDLANYFVEIANEK